MAYLDETGLAALWSKIKTLINGKAESNHKHDDYLPLAGSTMNQGAKIKWTAMNSKNPYIGYCSNSTDGTFMVGSIAGTNYTTGLAIGGSSGNLLWKGTKVATTSDIPSSLKNPNTLTIQGNGTTLTNGSYDGSAAKTVNITPTSIGAATSDHTHSGYANQNAFSNVTVGSTTIAADTTTDTLTLVAGSNVTLTPDATNDKITIAATNTNTTYTFATGDSNGQIKVTPSGGSAQNVSVKGLGSAAYTASTAYAASSHNHDAGNITSGTLASDRLPVLAMANGTEYATKKTYGGKTVYTMAINIGALPNSSTATIGISISGATIDNLLSFDIFAKDSNIYKFPFINSNGSIVAFSRTSGARSIYIKTTTNLSSYTGIIVAEYTKA